MFYFKYLSMHNAHHMSLRITKEIKRESLGQTPSTMIAKITKTASHKKTDDFDPSQKYSPNIKKVTLI